MSQNLPPPRNDPETVRKLIKALEQPDEPDRQQTVDRAEARARRWQRFERFMRIAGNVIFILLAGASLFILERVKLSAAAYWISLAAGCIGGVTLSVVAELGRNAGRKPHNPRSILLGGIALLLVALVLGGIVGRLSTPVKFIAAVFIIAFLGTLAVYGLPVSWRSLRETKTRENT